MTGSEERENGSRQNTNHVRSEGRGGLLVFLAPLHVEPSIATKADTSHLQTLSSYGPTAASMHIPRVHLEGRGTITTSLGVVELEAR